MPKNNRGIWVYDIETFGNFFSCIYYNVDTLERKDFIVCKWQDDLAEFIKFTTSNEMKGMIGFNNLNFDFPVIYQIIKKPYMFKNKSGEEKARLIKNIANKVIESEFSSISRKNTFIPQLDPYSILHFSNTAKRSSLKDCEVAMRWEIVQDLPFEHDHEVTEDQINDVMEYNFNDVLATHALYLRCLEKIELRKGLSKKYNLPLINANDPKLGSDIFAKILCEKKNLTWKQLKVMRTHRDEIKLSECIFDYIKFESKEFNALLSFFKNQVIKGTKSVFSDIPLSECKEILPYVNPKEVKKNVLEKLKIMYKGESYDWGTGGLMGPLV